MAAIDVLNYANRIFMSIGEPFLSSTEQDDLPDSLDDKTEVFEALFHILQDREVPQGTFDRLKAKAELEYVELKNPETSKKKYDSNILLGFGVH
jgi:hypothetical protein